MKYKIIKMFITISFFMQLLFLFSSIGLISQETEEGKIKIISQKAVLRLKPNDDSLIIKQLNYGEVFDIEERIGEWIKIKLPPNEEGFVVTGYIHQRFVERASLKNLELKKYVGKNMLVHLKDGSILKGRILSEDEQKINIKTSIGEVIIERKNIIKFDEVEKRKVKAYEKEIKKEKLEIIPEVKEPKKPKVPELKEIPTSPKKTKPQVFFGPKKNKKVEISFNLGGGFPQISASSSYSDSGALYLISSYDEISTINASSKNGLFFGGSIAYFVNENVGLQLSFGYIKSKFSNETDYNLNWSWYDGRSYSDEEEWKGICKLSVLPININLIGRFGNNKYYGQISFGYSLFIINFIGDAYMGVSGTYYDGYYQYIDIFKIPVNIDESFNAHGLNGGGGIDLKFADNIGITINAHYYFTPIRELNWEWNPGTYKGVFGNLVFSLDRQILKSLEEETTPLKINSSFFQVSGGIKFYF